MYCTFSNVFAAILVWVFLLSENFWKVHYVLKHNDLFLPNLAFKNVILHRGLIF